jgi:hypothetical protein
MEYYANKWIKIDIYLIRASNLLFFLFIFHKDFTRLENNLDYLKYLYLSFFIRFSIFLAKFYFFIKLK